MDKKQNLIIELQRSTNAIHYIKYKLKKINITETEVYIPYQKKQTSKKDRSDLKNNLLNRFSDINLN